MMASNGDVEMFISSLGIQSHYESMSRGVIDSRDVIYFIVVSAMFIFATKEVLSIRK